jgi:hypothetical protein
LGFVLALISLLWLASGRLPQAKKISISPFFSSPKELRCRRTPFSPHEQPTWSQAKAMSGGGGNGPLGFILALTNLLWPSGRPPQAQKVSISPFFSSPKELRYRRP